MPGGLAVPQKRVLMHRFPTRHIRYKKAACPLPPPLPKAACPLPPLPETASTKQWLEQHQHDEAEEQEAALGAERQAGEEASGAETQEEAKADSEIAEQLAGTEMLSMKAELEMELASQVRRALETAAEASDFLQRPDPNFLSVCFTLCVSVVGVDVFVISACPFVSSLLPCRSYFRHQANHLFMIHC